MASLEDLGSVGHALSALSYGRDTAACCAAEMAVHACERVAQSTGGDLVLFLMAAPANGRSAVVLYGGQHAQGCSSAEQNNIATGMRMIMGSLRAAEAPPSFERMSPSLAPPSPLPAAGPSTATEDDVSAAARRPAPTPPFARSGAPAARPALSTAHHVLPHAVQPQRGATAAAVTTRPMARFPALLSFSPMVGSTFSANRDAPAEVTEENHKVVPEQLSASLLGRLRKRFSNDRERSKHFLKLIRHSVSEFVKQLPPGNRTSTLANKYQPMTPVAVIDVSIEYTDVDCTHTVVTPLLTNTSDVDPVSFFGLMCYMIYIKDPAYMWLVEEFCDGADVPKGRRAKATVPESAPAAAGTAGGAAGVLAGAGTGGVTAAAALAAAAASSALLGAAVTAEAAAARTVTDELGRLGESGGSGRSGASSGSLSGGTAGESGGGRSRIAPADAAERLGSAAGTGGGAGSAAPPASTPAGGRTRDPSAHRGPEAERLSQQMERQDAPRLDEPLIDASLPPERLQLLIGPQVVASGVPLPTRTHFGRAALPSNVVVVRDVTVANGHEEDVYILAAHLGRGGADNAARGAGGTEGNAELGVVNMPAGEVALTLGAAASGGKDILWRTRSIG